MDNESELLQRTPGMTQIGQRWKVQAYLTKDAAVWLAKQMRTSQRAAGRTVADLVETACKKSE